MNVESSIALLALAIGFATWWLDRKANQREIARQNAERIRDEARAARRSGQEKNKLAEQTALEEQRYLHDQRLQATQRLTEWARKATYELSAVDHFMNCVLTKHEAAISAREKLELAARISALVDEGRWLFHNHHPDAYGHEKAMLNRGFRDNRLDPLVSAYQMLMGEEGVDPMKPRKDFAFKIQQLALPLPEQVLVEKG